MTAKIVKLSTVTAPTLEVDDDLVQGLKALLEMAEAGKIQGLAYVSVATSGVGQYTGCGTGWHGHLGGVHIVLGALTILQNRLIFEENLA